MSLLNQSNVKNPMLLKAQAVGLSPPEVRLGMFIDAWKVLTGDLWVLQAIKGFKIPFVPLLSQDTMPTKPVFPRLFVTGAIAPFCNSNLSSSFI